MAMYPGYVYRHLVRTGMDKGLLGSYDLSVVLGSGSYGKVYKCLEVKTGQWWAVKRIREVSLDFVLVVRSCENILPLARRETDFPPQRRLSFTRHLSQEVRGGFIRRISCLSALS